MAAAYKIAAGLVIFLRYAPEAETNAEHDVFYVQAPPPGEMTPDDANWLTKYGWRYDAQFEGWSHFT